MIAYGKSPIVLRPSHVTHILPLKEAVARYVPRGQQRASAKGLRVASINDDGHPITGEDVTQAIGVGARHAPGARQTDVAVPCRRQLLRLAFGLSAIRAMADLTADWLIRKINEVQIGSRQWWEM